MKFDLRKEWPALALGTVLLLGLLVWMHSRCPACQQRWARWTGQSPTDQQVIDVVFGKVPQEGAAQ